MAGNLKSNEKDSFSAKRSLHPGLATLEEAFHSKSKPAPVYMRLLFEVPGYELISRHL